MTVLTWEHPVPSLWTSGKLWSVYKTFDKREYTLRRGVGVESLKQKVMTFKALHDAMNMAQAIQNAIEGSGPFTIGTVAMSGDGSRWECVAFDRSDPDTTIVRWNRIREDVAEHDDQST